MFHVEIADKLISACPLVGNLKQLDAMEVLIIV